MVKVLGVSVVIYFLFLFVLGVLLFLYTFQGLQIEGFQVTSGTSGTYIAGSTGIYVKDCTGQVLTTGSTGSTGRSTGSTGSTTQCISIGKNTDRLTYLQRLPIGGQLTSTNRRYSLKYRADGTLILYDMSTLTTLWSSNTKGSSTFAPSYLINIGVIQARSIYDTVMPWIALPKTGSGSGSRSGSLAPPTYSIPSSELSNTNIYLQVTDYGDVVIFNSAGSTIWRTATGNPPVPSNACVPQPMQYPFTQEDCLDLKNIIAVNTNILNGTIAQSESPLMAEISPNTYMPLYAYIFGDWIYANNAPYPVTLVKNIGGVTIYIAEQGQYLKMVADDPAGTGRYYNISAITPWSGAATSWQDTYWTSGTSIGARIDGHYMLHLEGRTIQANANTIAKPEFIQNENGRIISFYGDYIISIAGRKWPAVSVKNVGGVNIYMMETFPRIAADTAAIKMVADDAIGTAKYIFKTGTISIGAWNDSYWINGTSAGNRSNAHYMIDKNDSMASPTSGSSGSSGSGRGPIATSDVAAAKAVICNLQPYYSDNTPNNPSGMGCAAYLITNPNPSSKWKVKTSMTDTRGSALITPTVGITASINNLSNEITTNIPINQYVNVNVNDMIYLGYLLDVQGPFVVASVSGSKITLTKKYIGPSLTNSIISVVSSTPFASDPASSTTPAIAEAPIDKELYTFAVSTSFTLATAATACASFGATVATYNQLVSAFNNGAHWCWYSLVKDDNTGNPKLAFPIQTSGTCIGAPKGVNETAGTTSALTCYGVKPPQGTTYTLPGTTTNIPILNFSTPQTPTGTPNDSMVPTLYNSPNLIDGYIYAGTSYITTTNTVLPDTLDIGDLIYLEAPCNKYDTDLGDGTCRAYDCNPGEVDTLQNNLCRTYTCRAREANQAAHVKNANGTCTAPIEYSSCPKTISSSLNSGALVDNTREYDTTQGDSVLVDATGNTCTYQVGIDTTKTQALTGIQRTYGNQWNNAIKDGTLYYGHPPNFGASNRQSWMSFVQEDQDSMSYSVKLAAKAQSYTYDVITAGIPDILATKTASNPSYIYPKTIGPFIVASVPSINNILIRTYRAGDLDANGKFLSISSKSPSGTPIANRVPTNIGRQNIRLYKTKFDSSITPASGSSGSKVSLTKKIVGCSIGTYGPSCTPCAPGQTTVTIGASTCSPCRGGYYCAGGVAAVQCPAGQYSATSASACTSCNVIQGNYCPAGTESRYANGIPCDAGYYCTGGATDKKSCTAAAGSYCPAGSSTNTATGCPAGYYCTGGAADKQPCTAAAGTYCPTASSTGTGVPCPAGYYCTGGAIDKTACTAGPGTYCPISSSSSNTIPCPVGYYCTGGTTDKQACTTSPGSYCPAGSQTAAGTTCPGGSYCTGGATNKQPCSVPVSWYCPAGSSTQGGIWCDAGYYCTGGAADKQPCTAAAAGSYCPTFSPNSNTILCPAGYYCTGGATDKKSCTAAAGSYCPAGSTTNAGIICPAGYYCTGGTADKQPCTIAERLYCPAGSTNTTVGMNNWCPAGYYCTGGATDKQPCTAAAGTYCAGLYSTNAGTACTVGYYCSGGATDRTACTVAAGSYCPAASSTATGTTCPTGYYCRGGTADKTACTVAPGTYCPASSTTNAGIGCPSGYYCTGGTAGARACTAAAGSYCYADSPFLYTISCPVGYYCGGGTTGIQPCTAAAGKYCAGNSITADGILCPAGYYCTGGATGARPCTAAAGTYCPAGSSTAAGVFCPAGYYCTGGTADKQACTVAGGLYCPAGSTNTTVGMNNWCPAGYYCTGGATDKQPCTVAAGTYCAGLSSTGTGTPCPVGYYCTGRINDKQACTVAGGLYCPAGSTTATGSQCPEGYYCTGGTADRQHCTTAVRYFCAAGSTTNAGSQCPAGYYCAGGDAGRGTCTATPGNYCPVGSTTATGTPCPVGYYCTGGGAVPQPCTAAAGMYCYDGGSSVATGVPCAPGYYCTGGTADKKPCTAAPGMYCPYNYPSTAAGIICPAGYYCTGGTADKQPCTIMAERLYCPAGSTNTTLGWNNWCPVGYYCTGGATDKQPCTAAAGMYCALLSSTNAGTACPAGSYCTGGSADALPCTAAPGYRCSMNSSTSGGSVCPAGSYCTGGSTLAIYCNNGTYSPDGARSSSACTTCPSGQIFSTNGAQCATCPFGSTYVSPSDSVTRCYKPCPSFYVISSTNAAACNSVFWGAPINRPYTTYQYVLTLSGWAYQWF